MQLWTVGRSLTGPSLLDLIQVPMNQLRLLWTAAPGALPWSALPWMVEFSSGRCIAPTTQVASAAACPMSPRWTRESMWTMVERASRQIVVAEAGSDSSTALRGSGRHPRSDLISRSSNWRNSVGHALTNLHCTVTLAVGDVPDIAVAVARDVGRAAENIARVTGRDGREALAALSPQRRLMTPEEVAHAVWSFLPHEARGLTGQCMVLDGGQTA